MEQEVVFIKLEPDNFDDLQDSDNDSETDLYQDPDSLDMTAAEEPVDSSFSPLSAEDLVSCVLNGEISDSTWTVENSKSNEELINENIETVDLVIKTEVIDSGFNQIETEEIDGFDVTDEEKIVNEIVDGRKMCTLCNKSFATKFYKRHMRAHKRKKLLTCSVCNNYSSLSSVEMDVHMRKHYGPAFRCSECEYICDESFKLKRHMVIHTKEAPFKCSQCEYSCFQSNKLQSHMLVHSDEGVFKCKYCSFSTVDHASFQRHTKTHSHEKKFSCTECGYICFRNSKLKQHMLTHTGEKPFKCCECGHGATQLVHLKRHMLTHSERKNYQCTLCDYSTFDFQQFKGHNTKTHQIGALHQCTVCDFSSAQLYKLKRHMFIHTGEKPYTCELCPYSSSQKAHIKRHIMLKHSDERKP
ncbi:oocyte zinc finger protein XlCOF7.1-like [Nilaparvata lugens]|uniref:oocyte zinc finger protein XlCOF7.1-like n=1 Tax=Nilaparvata lugens TaxID=108931 RepID=UPI00193CA3D2|nr:oocyte zinc finger protein XlCOF7.1-like [Nilaparvata lugens]XP_039299546.1 oocyte zinc finger protein XlCOF7.1-like [Nilaparvata lugens]XP_039299547.1 oocyte zinc finger protein XlCOF7.1-like [Nilaparvata lugens]